MPAIAEIALMCINRTLVLVLAIAAVAIAQELPAQAPATRPAFDPTDAYKSRQMLGWRLLVNEKLLAEPELAEQVFVELEHQLYQITRRVPAAAVEKLRKIPVWVELNNKRFPCMCYHPSRQWLANNGQNPDKAGGIEIANARTFLSWTHQQPYMVLHEMAHGYHYLVLGHGHEKLNAQFRRAVEAGTYETVLNHAGRRVRHYALNNVDEYFAEGSEAYFGTNDFYPFVRSELKQHDPELETLLGELWECR